MIYQKTKLFVSVWDKINCEWNGVWVWQLCIVCYTAPECAHQIISINSLVKTEKKKQQQNIRRNNFPQFFVLIWFGFPQTKRKCVHSPQKKKWKKRNVKRVYISKQQKDRNKKTTKIKCANLLENKLLSKWLDDLIGYYVEISSNKL